MSDFEGLERGDLRNATDGELPTDQEPIGDWGRG